MSETKNNSNYLLAEPTTFEDDQVIGAGADILARVVAEPGIGDGLGGKVLCGRCRGSKQAHRPPTHSRVKNGQIDMRCNSKDCECRCRTHYVGRDGHLRPYGSKDDSGIAADDDDAKRKRTATDDAIDYANAIFRRRREQKQQEEQEPSAPAQPRQEVPIPA